MITPHKSLDRVELYYSKYIATVAIVLAFGIVTTSGMSILGLAFINGIAFIGWIGLAILAPILFALVRFALRAFLRREPVVVFDTDGVTDMRQQQAFVPWSDVGHISLGWGNAAYYYLRFQFRTREIAERYACPTLALHLLWTRASRLGDYNIYLLTLRGSRRQALQAALRFHKNSVTATVKELNKDGARDLYTVDKRD